MKKLLMFLLIAIIVSTSYEKIVSRNRWDICLHGKRPPRSQKQKQWILERLEKNGVLAKIKNALAVSGKEDAQTICLKNHDRCDCRWIVEYVSKN